MNADCSLTQYFFSVITISMQILADLAASLRTSTSSSTLSIPPLIFRHPTAVAQSASQGVTTVEEEPRGLHPDSPYQFEKQTVTSIEPQGLPQRGSNVKTDSRVIWNNNSGLLESNLSKDKTEETFVFPLVLPGDFLSSKAQLDKMSGTKPSSSSSSSLQSLKSRPLNRVYVTPRSREDGGGVIVKGIRRRGLPGLVDFEEGAPLGEMGAIEDEEDSSSSRAKL
jgi:nucleoside diphosphate-linked moiety X motif protein 19